jgi:RHS repeat-associated protein
MKIPVRRSAPPGRDGRSAFTKTGSTYTWEDYLYGGQLLAARFSNGSIVHFDLDHLGSVRQETDASGAVIKYRDFWPYGEEATPPSGTERMKFTGHERDLGDPSSTADDMDYMHARYYKPLFARFLSPDPQRGSALAPATWNRYAYAAGNPLRYMDPTGRYLCSDTARCKSFEGARQATLNSSSASAKMKAAASAWGALGEDNGITVKFGSNPKGKAATGPLRMQAVSVTDAKGNVTYSMRAEGTITFNSNLRGSELQAVVVHEGSHVADAQALAGSFRENLSKWSNDLDLTGRQTEINAYRLTADMATLVNKSFKLDGGTFRPNMPGAEVDRVINDILGQQYDPDYLTSSAFNWGFISPP